MYLSHNEVLQQLALYTEMSKLMLEGGRRLVSRPALSPVLISGLGERTSL